MLKLLVRLYLYLRGIRFYRTAAIPKSAVFLKTEIKTVNDRVMVFNFYKETYEDYVHRFGKCFIKEFTGVVVEAKVQEGLPVKLYKFNDLKFFFKDDHYSWMSDRAASELLLGAFLDFIIGELSALSNVS